MSDAAQELDALLRSSIANAGPYVRDSFQLPEHAFCGRRLVALFETSRTAALATVTARGEPRVAPVATFLHGTSFCIPTVRTAARCRHIRQNPATSLTCFEHDWAVLAHGSSTIVEPSSDEFAAIEQRAQDAGLESVTTWGEGVYIRLSPSVLLTWTREATPESSK